MFGWFQRLLPQTGDFFGMFEAHSATLVAAVPFLMVTDPPYGVSYDPAIGYDGTFDVYEPKPSCRNDATASAAARSCSDSLGS